MARNQIQFQKGLSESEFNRLYRTEDDCFKELEKLRWPQGFSCPACGHEKGHRLAHRSLMQCASCRTQTSITAGTIFHSTKLPLTTWFRGMYHLTQSKNGISAMELMRRLGVSYNTAWLMKQKLMQTMKEREASRKLSDRIEMDDAYLGGERARKPGKAGRGAEGKTPFIAAVQTDQDGKPQQMALQVVEGFSNTEVKAFAKAKLKPGADVISDGLACFGAVIDHGFSHTVVVSGGGRRAAKKSTFKWVNTALGNIKSALTGTYRQVSPKHRPRYLVEFQYRFNRRYDLAGIMTRLAHRSVRTPPFPYRLVKRFVPCITQSSLCCGWIYVVPPSRMVPYWRKMILSANSSQHKKYCALSNFLHAEGDPTMYEQFLTHKYAISRHESAPYLLERVRYLEHCAAREYTKRSMRNKCDGLYWTAHMLHPFASSGIDEKQLRAAASQWAADQPKHCSHAQQGVISIARPWLRFMGGGVSLDCSSRSRKK